jgi:signal transduction histidine kinase/ActR/RegA family two-component response regulator
MAQKIVYVGGCFLHLFLLFGIISLCNIKLHPIVRAVMLGCAFAMYGAVLTMDKGTLFYKKVTFVMVDGVGSMIKEYGPLHTVFYAYMIVIMVASVGVLVYALVCRPDTSIRTLYVLIVLDVVSVTVFFGTRAISRTIGFEIETMPAFYIIAETVFLFLFRRIRLYDISAGISETLLEEGTGGIVCFDRSGRYLVANKSAKRVIPPLTKAKADAFLDRDEEQYDVILTALHIFMNNEIVPEPYILEKDDKIYEVTPNHLYDGRRKCGYYLLMLDVTKDRMYSRSMKEAAESAIAAEKAKSSFLAQMSHEIRTPINAVLGMNEMILRECKDDDILEYSENIQSAGKTLLLLINSILDFSKIESGKMEIVPVKYSTVDMISNCINSVAPRAISKSLNLMKHIDPNIPRELYGDDVRVAQTIVNLLTNAVKYTERGSVTLSIREESRCGNEIYLRIEVKDTGIGIKEEDMGKLFESFGRVEEKRNRNIEGTGLGMSIVTGLLDMMNSKLEVDSVYGKGSTFSFVVGQEIMDPRPIGDFELKGTEKKKTTIHEPIKIPGKKILVVDDNNMNLKVASRFLKLSEVTVDVALSGAEAIEKVKETKYDMIFLDHMMPKMDGMETLAKMRKDKLLSDGTIVIALTANAITGAKETYLEAGFDDYMSKPIDIKGVDDLLRKYFESNS